MVFLRREALQQLLPKGFGLLPQLSHRVIGAAIGALQLQFSGCLPPVQLLLGIFLGHLTSGQATPGGEVDLQQLIGAGGLEPLALLLQRQLGGQLRPLQRRAKRSSEGDISQGTAHLTGLLHAWITQLGGIFPALNPALQVEAAEAVPHQQDPRRQGPCLSSGRIVRTTLALTSDNALQ